MLFGAMRLSLSVGGVGIVRDVIIGGNVGLVEVVGRAPWAPEIIPKLVGGLTWKELCIEGTGDNEAECGLK